MDLFSSIIEYTSRTLHVLLITFSVHALPVSLALGQHHNSCFSDADCDKICGAGMVGHCEFNTCHCHVANECVHASDCSCGGGQIATCDNHQCHCHHHRMWDSSACASVGQPSCFKNAIQLLSHLNSDYILEKNPACFVNF